MAKDDKRPARCEKKRRPSRASEKFSSMKHNNFECHSKERGFACGDTDE
jgi:hypothetical protein